MTDVHALGILIENIRLATNATLAWTCFLRFTAQFGYTHGGLADMPGPQQRLEQTLLQLDWPTGWAERYMACNYVHFDPARLHLARTAFPYSWSEMLESGDYTRKQRLIVHEASEFGLKTGLIVPFKNARGGPAMITVAGPFVSNDPSHRALVSLAAMYTHASVRAMAGGERRPPTAILSMRERECLQWAAEGKSDWEIGEILSISAGAANAHMERAKRKFGVVTRMQAVVAGLQNGYVQI